MPGTYTVQQLTYDANAAVTDESEPGSELSQNRAAGFVLPVGLTSPLCSDPQEEFRGPEEEQTHTDWLTLNVGGRCFTTTR